jgi:hypothetical protein
LAGAFAREWEPVAQFVEKSRQRTVLLSDVFFCGQSLPTWITRVFDAKNQRKQQAR